MKLIFTRRHTVASLLIRLFTGSRWSHVACIVSDKMVIDSTFKHGGVRLRPIADVVCESSAFDEVSVPLADEQAAVDWLTAQLNKPYDWTAIVGFVFRSGWAEPDRWFCSELAEGAIRAGGLVRFRTDLARLTPGHVWMVV